MPIDPIVEVPLYADSCLQQITTEVVVQNQCCHVALPTRGVVRHHFESDAVEVRATAIETVEGGQVDAVAGVPRIDLERAGTNWFSAEIRFGAGCLRRDAQVHVRQERCKRRFEREGNGVLIGGIDLVDAQVEGARRRVERLIQHRVVGVFDIVRGEVGAIVEPDALPQVEDPCLVVGVVPLLG